MRPETLRQRVLTDGHPPEFQALTVRELGPGHSAFKVQQGEKLYLAPEKRVKVSG